MDSLTEIMIQSDISANGGNANDIFKNPEVILEEQINLGILIQHAAQMVDLKAPKELGVVAIDKRLEEMVEFACSQATSLANHNMQGICPSIELQGLNDMTITCVPQVIEFGLVECLKNAVYSTMATNLVNETPPPGLVNATRKNRRSLCESLMPGLG